MVRRTPAPVVFALCLAAATMPGARAQALQRLTVNSFDLSADTTAPRVDVPFHLELRLRVRERISQIYNLDLPMLAQLELLGDERETTGNPRGTQYRETITVVAHTAGPIAIAPATLQAIDARDGKPKEWYSNGLRLVVGGAPAHVTRGTANLLLWVAGLLGIALIAMVLLRRRRPIAEPIAAPPPAPAPPPPDVRSRRQQVQDALVVLRAERTRPAAVAVRTAIWRMVGASDGETLGDVLRRPDAREISMRQLLIALERAAFTYDADLRAAIEDACSALERYMESAA